MQNFVEKLRWWLLPHKRFYSYYEARQGGNGFWRAVKNLSDIPKKLVELQKKYPKAHYFRRHTR